ncbi:hypothetical protein ACFLYL_04455, partial [Chloroflexota bacterium]
MSVVRLRKSISLFIAVLLALLLLIIASPLAIPVFAVVPTAATLHVVGPGGNIGPNTLCPPVMARGAATFQTIQKAVDCALSGDTIEVAAGTYNENVVINKDLTLLGAQAGVCASDRDGTENESVIDAGITPQNYAAIEFTANYLSVTIDGFKIIGSRGAVTTKGYDNTGVDLSEFHFLNNIVEANISQYGTSDAALVFVQANVTEIDCNDISPTAIQSPQTNALRVIFTASNPPKVDAHYNKLHNASSSGFGVTGNDNNTCINVTHNEIFGNYDDGIFTYNSCFATLNITDNSIYSNGKKGIKFATGIACNPTVIDINVNCNNIYDNGEEGLYNELGNPMVDAEGNWWGDDDGSGPFHDPFFVSDSAVAANAEEIDCEPPDGGDWNCECNSNLDGTGDEIYADIYDVVGLNVDYCPWYINELFEEDDVETATGTGTAYFEPE